MAELGWLTRTLADVPPHDGWLSERERETLSTLRIRKRRGDWRLGRWAAKAAVAAWRGQSVADVEVLAAEDGAPEAFVGGARSAVALSLSHRAGRAVAAVADPPSAVGCDLEALEPRSPAFVREWLGPVERELVGGVAAERRDLAANLLWAAKEAGSKARREGLRLDLRAATVTADQLASPASSWVRLRVAWADGPVTLGCWREEPGWVLALVSDPAADEPPREIG
jgi:4'-phosphopantetheinyl transferase